MLFRSRNLVQVHHFKWDQTVFQRLLDVAQIEQDYAYSSEYQMMYDAIKDNNFKIDINNPNFHTDVVPKPDYYSYIKWGYLKNLILHV